LIGVVQPTAHEGDREGVVLARQTGIGLREQLGKQIVMTQLLECLERVAAMEELQRLIE